MRVKRVGFALLLAAVSLSGLRASAPQMGVQEIRPGMIGVGRTVFDGTRVEEFKVNILGVLENVEVGYYHDYDHRQTKVK